MALVVFLRGLNVGGHRRFRPSRLASELEHLGAVNIGATGTFVIRKPVDHTKLKSEISSRVAFPVQIVICKGRDVTQLVAQDPFRDVKSGKGIVRFVSVLSNAPRRKPDLPISMPDQGPWLVKVLAREGRFVIGLHKRQMKVIGLLGELDEIFGAPATTRSWGTIERVVNVLNRRP